MPGSATSPETRQRASGASNAPHRGDRRGIACALLAPGALLWLGIAAVAEGLPGWIAVGGLAMIVVAFAAVAARSWRVLSALALVAAGATLATGVAAGVDGIAETIGIATIALVVGGFPALAALVLRARAAEDT